MSSILTYFNSSGSTSPRVNVDLKRGFADLSNTSIESETGKSPETKRATMISVDSNSSSSQHPDPQFGLVDSVKSMISELQNTIDKRFTQNTELINEQFSSLTPRFDSIDTHLNNIEEQAGMRDERVSALADRLEQLEQRNVELEERVRELSESVPITHSSSGEDSWSPSGTPGINIKLLGDSNSAGKLKFGTGRGTLGNALPGSDYFAATVADLPDPSDSSFSDVSDVIVAVGTNDLRNSECDPAALVKQTHGYVNSLTRLHPSIHVYLPGVLPVVRVASAPLNSINGRIKLYNHYLKDLCSKHPSLTFIDCNMFSTDNGGLKPGLAQGVGDILHLNDQGLKLYFSRFKYALRSRHGLPVSRRRPNNNNRRQNNAQNGGDNNVNRGGQHQSATTRGGNPTGRGQNRNSSRGRNDRGV